jgi:hypothetical protein
VEEERQKLSQEQDLLFSREGILIDNISLWRTPEDDKTLRSWTKLRDFPLGVPFA